MSRRGTSARLKPIATTKPAPAGVIMHNQEFEWVWIEGKMNSNSSGIYDGCLERKRKGSTKG